MYNKKLIPLNLQYFAENPDGGSTETEGENTEGNQGQNSNGGEPGEKTFTQAELTATATKEKKEGKNSILKIFGLKDEKSAKAEAAAYLAWKSSQQTPEQKQQEETQKVQESEQRAALAESKLTVVMAGVNKDSIEDALAIAQLKVTEDKSLKDVLEEMKSQDRYKGFFSSVESNNEAGGTGSSFNHNKNNQNGQKENLGARLAKSNTQPKKSSYFSN